MMSINEVSESLNMSRQRVIDIERSALKKIKMKLLEIDCLENWVSILNSTKEKDPYNHCYDNNLDM